jgi:FlaA1/EpsC-like NDP-sugar epimerase
MKNSLLLANKYKVFGWVIFLVFVALGIACMQLDFKIPGFAFYHHEQDGLLDFIDYNLTNELALSGITIGLLMIVFTKEKVEDEYISMLRLKSLQWAVLLSYVILFIINFSFYGLTFLILLVYNLWTTLIVFIVIFYWSMFKLKKEGLKDEK